MSKGCSTVKLRAFETIRTRTPNFCLINIIFSILIVGVSLISVILITLIILVIIIGIVSKILMILTILQKHPYLKYGTKTPLSQVRYKNNPISSTVQNIKYDKNLKVKIVWTPTILLLIMGVISSKIPLTITIQIKYF